ncbi:helix-turn-helix domain-containing protein [Rhodohalobacter sp. 614A]|uniref:helix-turn-helix domain-containing protein n=1 Tax=Rhodohalobacter sp. 614A TaxID=2908649 RepID=UPI001F240FE4|nr:AraC family transcriptional regulator [Rhodohalobacter sp. 614A]
MAETIDVNFPRILYSNVSKTLREGELFIKQHVFDYIMSGTSKVFFEGKKVTFNSGDFRFAVRNRLSKFMKIPPVNDIYKSVSICVDQNTLQEIAREGSIKPSLDYDAQKTENVLLLQPNKVFKNYISSLLPYLEKGKDMNPQMVRLKTKETVLIFLESNPELKNILFDFSEPGKIDLEAYMNEHYTYNGSLSDFAYLTGRSLSTFRRDFKRIFKITPNKWLIKKRLKDACYLLKEKNMEPTEVFIETGFKNYSHFSARFKEEFGISPSHVA